MAAVRDNGADEPEWIKVYEVESENGGTVFMPRLCMHCEEAPCLKVAATSMLIIGLLVAIAITAF